MNTAPHSARTYREVLQDDESLAIFLRNMAKFDRQFCELMSTGADFTIRLEVHGNTGKLVHCRVHSDGFDRPADTEQASKSGLGRNNRVR